jgi:hypothetical protein
VIEPPLRSAEVAAAAFPPSMLGAVEEVARAAEPSSVQAAATAEEGEGAPEMSQPAMVLQECHAHEGMARDASPEIPEAEESSGAGLP